MMILASRQTPTRHDAWISMNAPHRMAAAVSTNAPIFMEATLVDVILDTSLTLRKYINQLCQHQHINMHVNLRKGFWYDWKRKLVTCSFLIIVMSTTEPSVVKTSMSAQRMTIRATANKFAETVQDHTDAPVGMATN